MKKYIVQNHLSLLIVAFLAGSALLAGGAQPLNPAPLGASELTTITNPHTFEQEVKVAEFTQGGGNHATTTVGASAVLTAAVLEANGRIEHDPGAAGDLTTTIQATSSWSTLLPNAGDSRSWFYRNTGTTTQDSTIAAGAGIILLEPDGQNVVIAGGNSVLLTCSRDSDTDVECIVDELIDAD